MPQPIGVGQSRIDTPLGGRVVVDPDGEVVVDRLRVGIVVGFGDGRAGRLAPIYLSGLGLGALAVAVLAVLAVPPRRDLGLFAQYSSTE